MSNAQAPMLNPGGRSGVNTRDPELRALPMLWRIAVVEETINAAATGTEWRYVWKANLLLTGIWIGVLSSNPAHLAGLELNWQADGDPIGLSGTESVTFPGLALCSQSHWAPIARRVAAHDEHVFRFTNNGAVAVVPRLIFRVEWPEGSNG